MTKKKYMLDDRDLLNNVNLMASKYIFFYQ